MFQRPLEVADKNLWISIPDVGRGGASKRHGGRKTETMAVTRSQSITRQLQSGVQVVKRDSTSLRCERLTAGGKDEIQGEKC